jgi:hypothetical protein
MEKGCVSPFIPPLMNHQIFAQSAGGKQSAERPWQQSSGGAKYGAGPEGPRGGGPCAAKRALSGGASYPPKLEYPGGAKYSGGER